MNINRVQRWSLQALGIDMAKKKPNAEKPAGAPAPPAQPADSYVPNRAAETAPVRSDKVAHARTMIEQGRYNDPQVIAEIINRLVQAIKD